MLCLQATERKLHAALQSHHKSTESIITYGLYWLPMSFTIMLQREPQFASGGPPDFPSPSHPPHSYMPPSGIPKITASRGAERQVSRYDAPNPGLIAAGHTAAAAPGGHNGTQDKGPSNLSTKVSEAMSGHVHFQSAAASAVKQLGHPAEALTLR